MAESVSEDRSSGHTRAEVTRINCAPEADARRTGSWRPAERIALGFVIVGLVCLCIGFEHVPSAGWVLLGFVAYLLCLLSIRFLPEGTLVVRGRLAPLARFLREAHVLFMIGPAYVACGLVNRGIFQRYFDAQVISWDRAIFQGHPNTYLAAMWPWTWLSEFLHFSYYTYLWLVPILGLSLYFMGRREAFRVAATTIAMTYAICDVVFLLFPVQGPYYTFPRVDASGHVFTGLVHATLERGAAIGTAFPSSHCAASVAVTLLSFRFLRRLAPFFLLITIGIVIGTVYGGFHYAIDAAAGLGVGLACGVLGPRIHHLLEGWSRSRG